MIALFLSGTLFCLIVAILVRHLFFVAVIEGQSMLPTFSAGEKVLVLRCWPLRWLPRNAIIATYLNSGSAAAPPIFTSVESPATHIKAIAGRIAIKRVVGLPGETIHSTTPSCQKWLIPPHHYFVRSDSVGIDSDVLGPVSFSCFQGIVITKLSGEKVNNVD